MVPKFNLNFLFLSQISTGRTRRWKVFPPLVTLVTLLLLSLVSAMSLWLWGTFWSTGFLSLFESSFLGVIGFAFVNFWFNREITTFMLGSREIGKNFKFAKVSVRDERGVKRKIPLHLYKIVSHLVEEVNLHFSTEEMIAKYGEPCDIPMPRLCTFTDHHFKIITVEGRNADNAAIFFSTGALSPHDTQMELHQLAALIEMELVKIYLRRGFARAITAMVADLSSALQNLHFGNVFSKALGILAGPLQFFLLLERSNQRSYEYDAATEVVACGRGMDLLDAIDKKVCPTLIEKGTFIELKEQQERKQRAPLHPHWLLGPIGMGVLKPIADWVDRNEYATDNKRNYRFFSLLDIVVREGGYLVNELWKKEPRATSLKSHLRALIKCNDAGREINGNNVKTLELSKLYNHDADVNYRLTHNARKIYQPISYERYRGIFNNYSKNQRKPLSPSFRRSTSNARFPHY